MSTPGLIRGRPGSAYSPVMTVEWPRVQRSDWLLPAALALVGVVEVFTVDGLPRLPAILSVVVPCVLLVGRRHLPTVFATASLATLGAAAFTSASRRTR